MARLQKYNSDPEKVVHVEKVVQGCTRIYNESSPVSLGSMTHTDSVQEHREKQHSEKASSDLQIMGPLPVDRR